VSFALFATFPIFSSIFSVLWEHPGAVVASGADRTGEAEAGEAGGTGGTGGAGEAGGAAVAGEVALRRDVGGSLRGPREGGYSQRREFLYLFIPILEVCLVERHIDLEFLNAREPVRLAADAAAQVLPIPPLVERLVALACSAPRGTQHGMRSWGVQARVFPGADKLCWEKAPYGCCPCAS